MYLKSTECSLTSPYGHLSNTATSLLRPNKILIFSQPLHYGHSGDQEIIFCVRKAISCFWLQKKVTLYSF